MKSKQMRFLPETAIQKFNERVGFDFEKHVIMVCRTGSQSHGMETPTSDEDYLAIVVPPVERFFGLSTFDHWPPKPIPEVDLKVYSLRKYIGLLLKNNPNVLETLWIRIEDYCSVDTTHLFYEIMCMRHKFSSLRAYHSLSGYAYEQLRRLEVSRYSREMGAERKLLVDKFGYDPKNASHLLRLYRMGVEFVETGVLNVYRDDAEELLSVKRGEWSLARVKSEAEGLRIKMKEVKEKTPLPKDPETEYIEKWLVETMTQYVKEQ